MARAKPVAVTSQGRGAGDLRITPVKSVRLQPRLAVRADSLSHQVYELLCRGIASGRYRPGERILEKQMAARLGISRTPVREALNEYEQPFQLSFNRLLRVGFQGSKVTPNEGLIVVRGLDERLGFGELVEEHLTDFRASNARFSLADLLRQSVYSHLAGYEDVNDAERLSQDPTLRLIGSEKVWDRGAALTSKLRTFETEILADEGNLRWKTFQNRSGLFTLLHGCSDGP